MPKPPETSNQLSSKPYTTAVTVMANTTSHKKQHADLIKDGLNELFSQLSSYLSTDDCTKIRHAFNIADSAHLGQFRQTGEPYITHPIAVSTLCATWKLDAQSIMAALLHDVLEDTGVDKITLANEFGGPVANLVDGLSKLDKLHFDSKETQQAESFRKMLLAMADDVRVILIKLADRLHNLSTMQSLELTKRRRIAHETLEIYAPIAHRLGLDGVYQQLQDLCFQQIHHLRSAVIAKALKRSRLQKRELFDKVLEKTNEAFMQMHIDADIFGREKNIASIYNKMKTKKLSLSRVLDVHGVRVLVANHSDCYLSIGILHSLFKPIPGRFKDYIALSKKNGYQSLHTSVIGPYGTPIEFQIRTHDMHRVAESGIATHWLYKDNDVSFSDAQKESHITLQSLLHIQQKTNDSIEFLEHIKVDLSPDAIYVFTPKSRIITLSRHATALDFAYSIHTDIGTHAVSATINGDQASLNTELRNGDRVAIITDKTSFPKPIWLKWIKTGKARSELRHYFKSQRQVESAAIGEQLFRQAFHKINAKYPEHDKKDIWERLLADTGCKTTEELFSEVGLGIRHANITAQRLLIASNQGQHSSANIMQTTQHSIVGPEFERLTIRGDESTTMVLSKCCYPIRGDVIVGHLLRRQGLIVHTNDCHTAKTQRTHDNLRWIQLDWDMEAELADPFLVSLQIIAQNEHGLLAKLASRISDAGSNIENITLNTQHNDVHIDIIIDVSDRIQLAQVIKSLRTLANIKKITRYIGQKNKV